MQIIHLLNSHVQEVWGGDVTVCGGGEVGKEEKRKESSGLLKRNKHQLLT